MIAYGSAYLSDKALVEVFTSNEQLLLTQAYVIMWYLKELQMVNKMLSWTEIQKDINVCDPSLSFHLLLF